MTDQETIARFIFLRSQGWSFNRITVELNISKPTLIKWSRQYQFDINNLRATETEALAERVFAPSIRNARWAIPPNRCGRRIHTSPCCAHFRGACGSRAPLVTRGCPPQGGGAGCGVRGPVQN